MSASHFSTIARFVAIALFAHATGVCAAEIRILSTPTLQTTLEEVRPQFERTSGHKLLFKFDAVALLKRQIEGGETFDIAILLPASIDDLLKQGKLAAGSRVDISRAAVGVAIHAGAPKPDVSSVAAFRQTLLNAKSMSYFPESASGTYFVGLFDRLGISAEAKSRLKPMKGHEVIDAVAKGEVELTVITVPNIVGVPGIEVAGLLPAELQNYTVFSAGMSSNTQNAGAAEAFVKFLMTPEVTAVMKTYGMERATP